MAEAMAPMVRLDGLVKTRSQSESVFELHVPHFAVRPGQMVAVIGESGCGKSTLLDMVALVMAPTRVERFEIASTEADAPCDVAALWAGDDEDALSALRRDLFGYVLQTGGLLPFLSVRQNICLPARIKGGDIAASRLEALAARLGVGGCLTACPWPCPSGSGNGWPSCAPWRISHAWCWPTSPRRQWTRPGRGPSWTTCTAWPVTKMWPWWWSPTTWIWSWTAPTSPTPSIRGKFPNTSPLRCAGLSGGRLMSAPVP